MKTALRLSFVGAAITLALVIAMFWSPSEWVTWRLAWTAMVVAGASAFLFIVTTDDGKEDKPAPRPRRRRTWADRTEVK